MSEGLINAVYMWVGMVFLGVEVRSCLNFCDEKFICHDLGPRGLRLEKWVTEPRVGVYV